MQVPYAVIRPEGCVKHGALFVELFQLNVATRTYARCVFYWLCKGATS